MKKLRANENISVLCNIYKNLVDITREKCTAAKN